MLCNVLKGSNKAREAKAVVFHGVIHTERRLHQMMLFHTVIYFSLAFFQRWWRDQSEATQAIVKHFVSLGQLELISQFFLRVYHVIGHLILDCIDGTMNADVTEPQTSPVLLGFMSKDLASS
ncbi:hypothetical protein L6452_34855 [Arctium lappa]|uniref:Uncharacterized protein n=1 Tax=Arctium lappa TaxID=4217 RepID=A0ACB8YKJ9_ARCLA|nr:hypothetical protein L6452_34855 [Arctium lappa]